MENLKPKEKEFVKEYVANNENGTQTVKKVYGIKDENYAGVKSYDLLRKPKIIQAVETVKQTIAERIPDDLLVEKNIALLNKMETKEVRLPDGTTEVIESDQIDARAVAKGLDIAHRVKGTYAPEKIQSVNVNVEITPKALEIAKKYEEELNREEDKTI